MRSIIWKQYGSREGQSKVARTESTFKKDCCWHVVMAQQLAVGGVSLVVYVSPCSTSVVNVVGTIFVLFVCNFMLKSRIWKE